MCLLWWPRGSGKRDTEGVDPQGSVSRGKPDRGSAIFQEKNSIRKIYMEKKNLSTETLLVRRHCG